MPEQINSDPYCNLKIAKGFCRKLGYFLYATDPIRRGEVILKFGGDLRTKKESTPRSLQIDEDLFLESVDAPEDYVNHSCKPNSSIWFPEIKLVAICEIEIGDVISFDYCSTEYDMDRPMESFMCQCGFDECRGEILGFRYMSKQQQRDVLPLASPYIRNKFLNKID